MESQDRQGLGGKSILPLIKEAACEVYNFLGAGHSEKTYQEALKYELRLRNISYLEQVPITIDYKGAVVGFFFADFVVNHGTELIVLELKAICASSKLSSGIIQIQNYLKNLPANSEKRVSGLLINFPKDQEKKGLVAPIFHHAFEPTTNRKEKLEDYFF
jgi:GxxExxY protein